MNFIKKFTSTEKENKVRKNLNFVGFGAFVFLSALLIMRAPITKKADKQVPEPVVVENNDEKVESVNNQNLAYKSENLDIKISESKSKGVFKMKPFSSDVSIYIRLIGAVIILVVGIICLTKIILKSDVGFRYRKLNLLKDAENFGDKFSFIEPGLNEVEIDGKNPSTDKDVKEHITTNKKDLLADMVKKIYRLNSGDLSANEFNGFFYYSAFGCYIVFYNYHSNPDNEISKLYKFNLNLLQF